MAKYSGLFKLYGKLAGLVFVGGEHEHVRTNDSKRGERMKKDAAFENVRKVQTEFGLASRLSKYVRDGLGVHFKAQQNRSSCGRFTAAFFEVIKQDRAVRGERVFRFTEFGNLLKGFEVNEKNRLNAHIDLDVEIEGRDGEVFAVIKRCQVKVNTNGLTPQLDLFWVEFPEVVSGVGDFTLVSVEQRTVEAKEGVVDFGSVGSSGGVLLCSLSFREGDFVLWKGMRILSVG